MATIKTNNNESVKKNVANKVWSGFCMCGKCILCIILMILLLVFFFNPVMFLFWSIIEPQGMAQLLYNEDQDCWYLESMRALNGWMIALYPFNMKKHFMEKRGIAYYSAKAQCRYYFSTGRDKSVLRQMTKDAVQELWKGNQITKSDIAFSGVQLSDEQFADLIDAGCTKEAHFYIHKWTPNVSKLRYLIEHIDIDPKDIFVADKIGIGNPVEHRKLSLLLYAVKTYGLSDELISLVFEKGNSKIIDEVREALVVYSQRQFVLSTQRNGEDGHKDWITFCNTMKDVGIRFSAQELMTEWQYDVFHKAGYALDVRVINSFLAEGDLSMRRRIFEYEATFIKKRRAYAQIG